MGRETSLETIGLKRLIDALPDEVFVLDRAFKIISRNRAAEANSRFPDRLFGNCCHEEHYGRSQPCNGPFLSCPVRKVLETGEAVHTIHRHADSRGQMKLTQLTVSPLPDESGETVGFLEIRRDVTGNVDEAARLQFLTHYDPLTGLLKQQSFTDQIQEWTSTFEATSAQIALGRVRLIAFDSYVESLGVTATEHLLKEFAERLQAWSVVGAVFGFIGNSDFLVAAPMLPGENGAENVEHLVRSVVRDPFDVGVEDVFVRAGIGVATSSAESANPEDLLRRATANLLARIEVPQDGVGTHAPNGYSALQRRLDLENQLRLAIERQELRVAFQAQYKLETGALRGFEALLRWPSQHGTTIGPSEFVPVLEESGLIFPITLWIVREGASLLKRLRAAGCRAPRVSVNVPASLFASHALTEAIQQALEEQRCLGEGWLELEVTESGIMRQMQHSIATMDALKSKGVSIAVDDFGVGHSSLSYLQKLPVHCVKIDRAFIKRILTSDSDHAIVAAIVAMAHHLDLEVIAEGVETSGQRAVLKNVGVDTAQGFLLAMPTFADDVVSHFSELQQGAQANGSLQTRL